MFGKNQSSKPQNKIDSLIRRGHPVSGNVVFSGGLRVDGEIRSNVSQKGVAVNACDREAEQARIEGRSMLPSVVNHGTVVGPVSASDR